MLRLARKAPAQKPYPENPMTAVHYIGYCSNLLLKALGLFPNVKRLDSE